VYSGTILVAGLKCREFSRLYKKFTRMALSDCEVLMNLVGPKTVKRDTRFRSTIPVQERMAVTLRFWATGDSYTRQQCLFKISKQKISQIVPEMCQAIVETPTENIQAKNYVLCRATCFAHKIDGLEH